MFTIGCFGDAAAASLMIDHTSCLCPATLLAGLNFSSTILLLVKLCENEDEMLPDMEIGETWSATRGICTEQAESLDNMD